MALLVVEAGKNRYFYYFIHIIYNGTSYRKKAGMERRSKKTRSLPLGKTVNKTPGISPSYLLTHLLKPNQNHTRNKTKWTSSSSNFKVQRKYTREKAKQNRYLTKERLQ
jgi:hypothetical protein